MAPSVSKQVKEECHILELTQQNAAKVCQILRRDLEKGLGKSTNAQAVVKCFPTYVRKLPNGEERGKFLALDLGGTNFRVLLVDLGNTAGDISEIFVIPADIMTGPGSALFDHIAECLSKFVKKHGVESCKLSLGFTFSFPCRQEGLTRGTLVTWTKGFNCSDVEGKDVVKLLEDAIRARGDVEIDVCALLNDTTGTLMSCAWRLPNSRIGLIVGTGTNACYVEKLENVGLWDGDFNEPNEVVINTEWGAFGDDGSIEFVRTDIDRQIDQMSINPGKQLFEKMISGLYLGEVVRMLIVSLTQSNGLFGGKLSKKIQESHAFETKFISEMEMDNEGEFENCEKVLKSLELEYSQQDLVDVRYICQMVSQRAAGLASAGVACLLNKMGVKNVVVAVDGSVYRFHPHFHNLMTKSIGELVDEGIEFKLMLSEDGSGRGAALVAAVASRL